MFSLYGDVYDKVNHAIAIFNQIKHEKYIILTIEGSMISSGVSMSSYRTVEKREKIGDNCYLLKK